MVRTLAHGRADLARLQQTLEELALREELAGQRPTGFLRAAERAGHDRVLRGWLEEVLADLGGAPARGSPRALRPRARARHAARAGA